MQYIEITSSDNSIIKNTVKIINRKSKEENIFFVEGYKFLKDCFANSIIVEKIFIDEHKIEKFTELLELADNKNIQVYCINDNLVKKLTNTKTPQGVFAVAKNEKNVNLDEIINNRENVLVLDKVQDPGNVGSIIRTAVGLGYKNLVVSSDCADVYSQKVLRSTMGAVFNINILKSDDITQVIEKLNSCDYDTIGSILCEESLDIREV